MKVNVNYPLPTVHMNGTSRDMLLEGEMKVYDALNKVSEALEQCEFHARDYYVQDANYPAVDGADAFSRAMKERAKHIENLVAFKQYNLEQVMHLRSQ